jgi:hypothetical protein
VLSEIAQQYEISGTQLAKKWGRDLKWVNSRMRLAMKLSDVVAKALDENKMGINIADIISSMNMTDHEPFLLFQRIILRKKTMSEKQKIYFFYFSIFRFGKPFLTTMVYILKKTHFTF